MSSRVGSAAGALKVPVLRTAESAALDPAVDSLPVLPVVRLHGAEERSLGNGADKADELTDSQASKRAVAAVGSNSSPAAPAASVFIRLNDAAHNATQKFVTNEIITSKYTWWNFRQSTAAEMTGGHTEPL